MEKDAAEVKKALATGALKETHTSPCEYPYLHVYIIPMDLTTSAVPPIVCYCLASILMTVVNKVRSHWQFYLHSGLTNACYSSLSCLEQISP